MKDRVQGKGMRNIVAVFIILLLMTGGHVAVADSAGASQGLRTDYMVSGDRMIWLELTDSGLKKLVYRNDATGEERQITDGLSAVDAPYIGADWIVWADKGEEPLSNLNWEIHGYHIPTGKKQQLSREAGSYGNPSVDGHGAVWYERTVYGRMIYRDHVSGLQLSLGEGRFPVLANRIVVYKHARDGGLSMLDLSSGVERRLVTLGGSSSVDWFVFNGTHVLASQQNGSGESQYIALNVSAPSIQVHALIEAASQPNGYSVMLISHQYAAFITLADGVPVLQSVKLDTMSLDSRVVLPSGSGVIGIRRDKLLYVQVDGQVREISLNRSGGGGDGELAGASDGHADSGQVKVVEIDERGGVLEAGDGAVRVQFAPETFSKRTQVRLEESGQDGLSLYDESGRVLELASGVWRLDTEQPLAKAAVLWMRYADDTRWSSEPMSERLAIYRWSEQKNHWVYVGGTSRKEPGAIEMRITELGQYAVMLRRVTFPDVTGHWVQQAVDTLASHGIVNGMTAERYEPQRTLTRAEFTKLLAGALGMQPSENSKRTFEDVKPGDWHYGWIEAAEAAGIVQGDRGMFRPNEALTREQMMVMLARAVDVYAERQLNDGLFDNADERLDLPDEILFAYSDGTLVSDWARSEAALAVRIGLIEGSGGKLDPHGLSTRAQAATVIYRLSKALYTI